MKAILIKIITAILTDAKARGKVIAAIYSQMNELWCFYDIGLKNRL